MATVYSCLLQSCCCKAIVGTCKDRGDTGWELGMCTEKWPSGVEIGQKRLESWRDIPTGNVRHGKIQSPRGEEKSK